jgi:hypothetical protein
MTTELFTLPSTITLAGGTAATLVVANSLQRAFDFNPRWLALLIAQTISIGGVYFTRGAGSDYFIGVLNGFLIYSAAAGTTNIAGGSSPTGVRSRSPEDADLPHPPVARNRRFFSSWF